MSQGEGRECAVMACVIAVLPRGHDTTVLVERAPVVRSSGTQLDPRGDLVKSRREWAERSKAPKFRYRRRGIL